MRIPPLTAAFVLSKPNPSFNRNICVYISSNGYAPNYDPRDDSWGSRGPVPADDFQDGPGGDQRLYDERMNDDYYYDDPSFGPQQQGYQQDYEYQEDRRGPPPPPNSNFDFRRQDQFEPQSYVDEQGRRQQPPHMQYDPNFEQPVYPPQDSFDEVPPPGNYYDETRGGYQRQYQQQFQDDFARPGDDNGYEYQQEDGYRYNTPRPPPPPQQFDNDKTFDRRQSPQYEDPANNYFEDGQRGQYDHTQPQGYEQNSRPRPPYRALQRRQQRPPLPRTDLVQNDSPFEYDPVDERMDRMMSSFPRSGSDIMDQMMSEMMTKTRMMDEMLDRFNSQMNAGMMNAQGDQPPLDEFRLMDEALEYLNTDAEVTDVLGNGIQLGPPFSRSSSSEMVNGISTSRLQLGIPIRGSRGEGRAMLFADDEGITQIGLDAKGHDSLIDVNLDGTRTRSNSKAKDEEVIDATVVDNGVDKETD